MTAHLIVRSVLTESDARDAFDRWYGEDHMPQAISAFRPNRCWRSWSALDSAVHYANYEFSDIAQVKEMMASSAFKALVDDFSQTWDGKVVRERDVTVTVQHLDTQA